MKIKKLQNQSEKSFHDYITSKNKADSFTCYGDFSNNKVKIKYYNDSGFIGQWTYKECFIVPSVLNKRSNKEKKSTIASLNRA